MLLRDCAVPELHRVKHRIHARTDPEKGRLETVAWIKRLSDMRRVVEKKAPGVFSCLHHTISLAVPRPLRCFTPCSRRIRAGALLHGEPGCGKSTLALKFAWQKQGAFDAVVYQFCGQRPVAVIATELATKLKLRLDTKPPEEQIAAAKAWLAERQALLVLDDIWETT